MFYRKTVQEYQIGVEWRDGKIVRTLKPGVYWDLLGNGRRIELFDTRATSLRIPGQEVMLGDRTSLKMNIAGTCRIVDPVKQLRTVANLDDHLNQLIQLRLRDVAATKTLDDVLGKRTELNDELAAVLKPAFETIGYELLEIKVKDIILPADLRSAHTEAIAASLRGKAQLEQARSQSAALRNLANTADLLEKHPQLVQLLSLQKDGSKLNLFFEQSASAKKASREEA